MPKQNQDNAKPTADLTSLRLEQIASDAELQIVVSSRQGEVEYREGATFPRGQGSGFILANDRIEAVDGRTILRSAESVRIKSDSMECVNEMPAPQFMTIADLFVPALEHARSVMKHEDAEIFYFDSGCKLTGALAHDGHASVTGIRVELQTAKEKRTVLISRCTQCSLHHVRLG
jgi:hypothetical protein